MKVCLEWNDMQGYLVSHSGQCEAQTGTWGNDLLTIREQVQKAGHCLPGTQVPIKNFLEKWSPDDTQGWSCSQFRWQLPKALGWMGGALYYFLAPDRRTLGVLCQCFCCWPGSLSSPQPSAKDWSHGYVLFQGLLCVCARSWALASFYFFGEDKLWWGCAKHRLEIIFGDKNLFSSRHWRLHSNYESETLGYSKYTWEGEVVIKWLSGDCIYRLTFRICCAERANAPVRMGPDLLG